MEQVLPESHSFDEAWAEASGKKPKEDHKEEKTVQPQTPPVDPAAQHPKDESHLANADQHQVQKEAETIDYKDLYEKEVQKTRSWEGRIRKANQAADEAAKEVARMRQELDDLRKAQADGRQTGTPKVDPADSDEEVVQAFLKEFPDLQAPLQAFIRKEARALLADEMKDIKPKVQKFEESEAERKKREEKEATEAHFKVIEESHPDFRDLVDSGELDTWISSKPAFLQDSLVRVRDKGTASEVIEMFTTMKAETGKNVAPKPAHEPGDKHEKLKSMVAVPGSTGGPPPAAPNRNDFDAAWKEANRK